MFTVFKSIKITKGNTANDYDGVESVVIGYIASHGVTDDSTSTFTLSTGGGSGHGCTVTSRQMSGG